MNSPRAEKDLKFAERLAKLLDTSIRIPGTRFRFGLDPLIGMFPFIGDVVTLAMSLLIVLIAARNGAGGRVLLLMLGNILVDTVAGSVPVAGSVFDFFYRSNTRNLALLQAHFRENRYQGSGKGLVIGVILLLTGVFIGIVYLIGIIISGFFRAFPEVYNRIMELFG